MVKQFKMLEKNMELSKEELWDFMKTGEPCGICSYYWKNKNTNTNEYQCVHRSINTLVHCDKNNYKYFKRKQND